MKKDIYVPTLTLHETASRFRGAGISTSEMKIGDAIEQGLYPFGICIKSDGKRSFEIYAKFVDEFLAERAVPKTNK